MTRIAQTLLCCLALASLGWTARSQADDSSPATTIAALNQKLGRGMNLGNALDASHEGEWGVTLQAEYFQKIKEAGFQSVRIPIRWSAHTSAGPPWTIDPKFLERVDWAVKQALDRKLTAIINVHHFDELYAEPEKFTPQFLALWGRIAEHYRNQGEGLYFEPLNEPHDPLTAEKWNKLFAESLAIIRKSNPTRAVIVGPGLWNNIEQLEKLKLPDDRRLIVTFHYYNPFEFTHQGAEWAAGSQQWLGKTWRATPEELAALRKDFSKAAEWGKKNNRPIFLGEFGSYQKADPQSRLAWTRAVAREAEKLDMSWSYWEFCAGFGAYDPITHQWREGLRNALVDEREKPASPKP